MTSLSWAELAERQRPLSPERVRAEIRWAQLTGRAPAIFGEFVYTPGTPFRPAPIAPRGKGRRKAKAARPVLVETRRTKMLTCPDGKVIACKRRVQSYIAA